MQMTEQFFWSLFCDNYLEITKTRAYDENNNDESGNLSARLTLYHGFKILLQLYAPFMPHITEELYQLLYDNNSIHQRGSWPRLEVFFKDFDAAQSDNLLNILELVRKVKAKDNLSIKHPIKTLEISGVTLSKNLIVDLKNVTSTIEIKFVETLSNIEQNLITDDIQINVMY